MGCLNNSATLILNMKFLVLFACVAAANAVQLVTYPSGAVAPAKTPEVLAAEAAHFGHAAYAGVYNVHNGYYGYPALTHANGLVAYANGAVAPAKTPEVLAAEQAHFAEHGIAAPAVYAGYPTWSPAGLVAHPNGAVVPVESPEIAAARAAHLAAHAAA